MNGKRLLLDTNAVISLLKGTESLLRLVQNASWIGVSIISKIEFLSFSRISKADIQLFNTFLTRVEVIDLSDKNDELVSNIIRIRKLTNFKLPDAIIAATALSNHCVLVTPDKKLSHFNEINIESF